jgi:hypothetical protein
MDETTNTDVCKRCGERPREVEKSTGYIRPLCSSCHNKQRSPEAIKRNQDKNTIYRREYRKQQKVAVLNKYGGKCYCCGESDPHFLTIDHVQSDGHEKRKQCSGQKAIFQYLYGREVDLSVYRVACFNCNCARVQHNGTCPHFKAKLVE